MKRLMAILKGNFMTIVEEFYFRAWNTVVLGYLQGIGSRTSVYTKI
jgi:hypothetical protein